MDNCFSAFISLFVTQSTWPGINPEIKADHLYERKEILNHVVRF
jgi:hypothetical protein